MVPVSMIWPLKVSRSTMATQSRGSVNVLVHPVNGLAPIVHHPPGRQPDYPVPVVIDRWHDSYLSHGRTPQSLGDPRPTRWAAHT